MKISIIVPSYNQGSFIEDTLLSIINQSDVDKEIIVIDGGSKDETLDLIKKYEQHIAHWVSEPDKGQSDALNKGFAKATGDILCWLNSDDLFVDSALQMVLDYFSVNPDIDFLQGQVINFSSSNKSLYTLNDLDEKEMVRRIAMHQPGVFWRRRVTESTGFIDESLYYCMDYDLWMRFYFKFKMGFVNKPLARFRIHDSSKTNDNPIKMYYEYRKVVSRFFNSISTDAVKKLQDLELYDNDENIRYDIAEMDVKTPLQDLLRVFVLECAIQEYSEHHKAKARELFNQVLSASFDWNTFKFKVKNELGIRKLANWLK